jgi:hypothetical protein
LFQIAKLIRDIDRFEDPVVSAIVVRRLLAAKHIDGLKKLLCNPYLTISEVHYCPAARAASS